MFSSCSSRTLPAQLNPALNNVERVVEETEPPNFELPGVKKIFPHICWVFCFLSIIVGCFVTVVVIQLFVEREDDVVVQGTLTFSFALVFVGAASGSTAIVYSLRAGGYEVVYPIIYVFSMVVTCILGLLYCQVTSQQEIMNFTSRRTSVYPGSFVMIHSVLWMTVGMITEPYWAIPVVSSLAAAVCLFYFLLGFCHSPDRNWDIRDKINSALLFLFFMSVISVQLLFFFIGGPFFNEEIISLVF